MSHNTAIEYLSFGYAFFKKKKPLAALGYFAYLILRGWGLCIDDLRYRFIRACNRGKGNYPIVKVENGYLMHVDLKDKGISKELFLYKKREQFSTDYVKEIICKDDIVIDIGANIGYYALLEAKLASKGKVYAIEPVPKNTDLLKKNIELNHCNNISLYQMAVGDKEDKAKMYVSDRCNWSSLVNNTKDLGKIIDEIDVPLTTLDKFVESYVSGSPTFVRMDVEGYEYQIIKGAAKILSKKNQLKLCIELHPQFMPKEDMNYMLGILRNSAFRVAAIFLDPKPPVFGRRIGMLNKLRRSSGFVEFGAIDKSFESLDKLLEKGWGTIAFFEK